MEPSKPSREQLFRDPVYKSSLILRSVDLASTSTKTCDLDLESQQEKGGDDGEQKAAASKSSKRRRVCSLCCCYSVYVTLLVLLTLTIVVVKLVPKDPSVSLGDFQITEFTSNASSSSALQIQISLNVMVNLTNRNSHAETIYKDISLGIYYKDENLGNISLPRFNQRRKSITALTAELSKTTTTIQEQPVVDNLRKDVANSDVQLEMRGSIKGKHKILGLKGKSFNIAVHCKANINPEGVQPKELSHSCYYDA